MELAQVEKHFDALDLATMKPGGVDHFTAAEVKADPGTVVTKVCSIYQKVKPFLSLAANLFFVPKKWRESLTSYMALMDTICPS